MLPIKGVYEIAIRVKDLARAELFYTGVLGLKEGLRDERRNWLFPVRRRQCRHGRFAGRQK